jgi:hypothetical protein
MNHWLIHVKKFREKHPKLTYKEALQQARKSYKPTKPMKGGGIFDGRPSGTSRVDYY